MYMSVLEQIEDEWKDADFVGTISWRASRKVRIPRDLDATLARTGITPASHDVVALAPLGEPALAQATRYHARFLEIWGPLLVGLGYSPAAALSDEIPGFASNYWLATPTWMRHYIGFMKRVRPELETRVEIQEPLFANPMYGRLYPPETCRRLWGRDYAPYHPFVCERLPCFFFWFHGARVRMGT